MGTESWGNSRQRRVPDYYGILGVEPGVPFQDIQAAYWSHANARDIDIASLNAAYEVLGDQSRRQEYDAEREQHGVVPHRASPKQLSDDGPRLQGKLYGFLH